MQRKIYTEGSWPNKIIRLINYIALTIIILHLISIENIAFELKDMINSSMILFAPLVIFGGIYFQNSSDFARLMYVIISVLLIFYFILLGEFYGWSEFVGDFEKY